MWTFAYWLVAFLCLFGLSGISIIMLLLYPALLVGHAFVTGSIAAANNRRATREAAKQTYEWQLPEHTEARAASLFADPALMRYRKEEWLEQIRLQEVEAAEAQSPSEQSLEHHHEVLSSASADEHMSLQERLEAETRG